MNNIISLVGQKFGRLTVIKFAEKKPKGHSKWLCKCDCGNYKTVDGTHLKRHKIQSCGCLHKEITSKQNTKNLIGQRFGKLLVVERAGSNKKSNAEWLCLCDCGNEKIVLGTRLRKGITKSCGCLIKTCGSGIVKKGINSTHGLSGTRIYGVWASMKARCFRKTEPAYKYYGARGIIVCDEWKNDFMNFYNWAMSNGYKDNLTIDRIDVNGNYEPNNCRFITMAEQCNNRRSNRFVDYQNKKYTISQIHNITKLDRRTIKNRIKKYGVCEKIFKKGVLMDKM